MEQVRTRGRRGARKVFGPGIVGEEVKETEMAGRDRGEGGGGEKNC